MSGAILLRAEGLAWEAGGRSILGPLDLELRAGESLVVVGPNGAGKTTLLRLLAGLLQPAAGRLAWRGRPLASLARREVARGIAYVPQIRPARVPLTVEQMVLQGRYPYLSRLQVGPAARDWAAVERALALVEIAALRHRPLDELSGGERQAVYIAAALAQEAELLILDEPTTYLDPHHQREVAALLLRLGRDAAQTVLTATHDLNFASRVADRILALRAGRAVACGPPAELVHEELLRRVFDAPFEIVRRGAHPVTVLELGP